MWYHASTASLLLISIIAYENLFFFEKLLFYYLFSSAHFGRTLEYTLSVRVVMTPLLNWVICPNIFVLICLNILSKIVQIFLVKNCVFVFGQKLCKYFWSKIVQIFLVKNCANFLVKNIFLKNCANIFW